MASHETAFTESSSFSSLVRNKLFLLSNLKSVETTNQHFQCQREHGSCLKTDEIVKRYMGQQTFVCKSELTNWTISKVILVVKWGLKREVLVSQSMSFISVPS